MSQINFRKRCRSSCSDQEVPFGGQHDSGGKTTAREREAFNHNGETAPPLSLQKVIIPRRKMTPASTSTVGAQEDTQEPDYGSTVRLEQELKTENSLMDDAKTERPAGECLCYGAIPEMILNKKDLDEIIWHGLMMKLPDGDKNPFLAMISDQKTISDISLKRIATVICGTDYFFQFLCPCYDRLKKLIQIGVGESLRLQISLPTRPLLSEMRAEKKLNIIVDTPSFLVKRELAIFFKEGLEIMRADDIWDLVAQCLTKTGEGMFMKLRVNKSWIPDLETLADSRYLWANHYTMLCHALEERRQRHLSSGSTSAVDSEQIETRSNGNEEAAPSTPDEDILSEEYVKYVLSTFYTFFNAADPQLLFSSTAENFQLVKTSYIETNTAETESEMVEKSSKLTMSTIADPSANTTVDDARNLLKPENSGKAHEVNLESGLFSLPQPKNEQHYHVCDCSICYRGLCQFHAERDDFIDQGKFLTGSILRLMSRRLHSMVEISAPDPQEVCYVCRKAFVGEKKTVDPLFFCVACQVKIHAECRSKLFDLCAPIPALSLKDRQRKRYALHEYVNNDFKPRIPALVVYIIILLTFSHQRVVKGMYRNTEKQDSQFELLRKRIEDEGKLVNLITMEPLLLGELLKYFFSSLRPRLIGQGLFNELKKCVVHKNSTTPAAVAEFKNALAKESVTTRETLIFLIMHLQDINSKQELQMSAGDLARAFAPVLIDGFKRELNRKYVKVLKNLLQVARPTWMYLFSVFVSQEEMLS